MKKFFLAFFICAAFCASLVSAQNYSIERYLNMRSASSPTLSTDGKRLAFLTNITGTNQVWMMDASGGYPEQITAYQDVVSFVKWSPAGNGLIFGKAHGGDENTQFFWMSNNGADVRELTSDPKTRFNFGDFSDDGRLIYYTSNKRDKNFFDVYAMDLATGKETLVFQQDGNNDFVAASKDGSKIIISRDSTELGLDNSLYLIDARTDKETLLTPHTGASQFGDVKFLPDGDSILLATNKDREFISLAQIDNLRADAKNDIRFLDKTADWDVEGVEVSPRGDTLAYTVNREGFSELNLRKIETDGKPLISNLNFKNETVKLPAQGIVGGLDFSKDGSKIAFTFSAARYNTDIWTYDLRTKQLTQVTKSSRAGIPRESFVEPTLIKYKTFDGKEISAWYYNPTNLNNGNIKSGNQAQQSKEKVWRNEDVTTFTGARPVIVSVHGGPEGQERPGFNSLYQYFLSRGYAILATNVRGSTGYGKTFTHLDDVQKREDSVKDLAYAVEWLKTSGGADPKRIAVMGGSYGGYMTLAAVTLYPDLWAAAVDTVGIANWESFLKNTSGYRRRQREVEYGRLDRDLDFLRSISPLAKVDKIRAPLFVIQGKNDPRVPYTEAEQIVTAIKNRGGTVEYKLYDDEGHGIAKLKNRLELYPLVADFLDKYMK
ncbi:MAG: S9 family peptidase [Acidobacteriota bacterium]|nr:S9 family peptidase [Acidobacteriota bacterium]